MYRKPQVYINDEILDMFDDEDIEINSSVKQLSDISKVFTEYSQSFTVPASPKNNRIFKHYYDFNISKPLDARKKIKSFIKIDGFDYVDGWVRVESIAMRYNNPFSYEITFFGNLVNLVDQFGESLLSDLDFTEFNHVTSDTIIQQGRTTGLFNESIIYPFISRYRRWFYSSDPANQLDDDENLNLHFRNPHYDEYKPAIKMNKIITAIENKFGLKLNGYLKDTELEKLYLWLNKEDGELLTGNSEWQFIEFEGSVIRTQINDLTIAVERDNGSDISNYNVSIRLHNASDDSIIEESVNESVLFSGFSGSRNVKVSVKLDKKISVKVYFIPLTSGSVASSNVYVFTPTLTIADNFSEMKVSDFVSGLVKMFNLIIESKDGINFQLTRLDEWYQSGKVYDITDNVDYKEYNINRPEILNEIVFKWEESDTVLYKQFKTLFGYNWGDNYYKVLGEDGKQVEGETYSVELPFQQSVYERLVDAYTGQLRNVVWAEGKGLENHLFFAINRDGIYNPSKVSNFSFTQTMLAWDSEIEEYSRTEQYNSLYFKYYQDYISDMFSIRRKEKEVSCVLPSHLISNIKMNDRLIIDGIRYIIEELKINLLTGKTQLKLLNDIF